MVVRALGGIVATMRRFSRIILPTGSFVSRPDCAYHSALGPCGPGPLTSAFPSVNRSRAMARTREFGIGCPKLSTLPPGGVGSGEPSGRHQPRSLVGYSLTPINSIVAPSGSSTRNFAPGVCSAAS
jgi:hypothetical protein